MGCNLNILYKLLHMCRENNTRSSIFHHICCQRVTSPHLHSLQDFDCLNTQVCWSDLDRQQEGNSLNFYSVTNQIYPPIDNAF